jgi:hypothetical protein
LVTSKLSLLDFVISEPTGIYFTQDTISHMVEALDWSAWRNYELMLDFGGNTFSGEFWDKKDDSISHVEIRYVIEQDQYVCCFIDTGESIPFTIAENGTIIFTDGRAFIPINILAEDVYNEALALYNSGRYQECYNFLFYNSQVGSCYTLSGAEDAEQFQDKLTQLQDDAWSAIFNS